MRENNHSRTPRFKVGDTVRMKSKRRLRFDGLTGKIVEVRASRHSSALDRYVVHIEGKPKPEVFVESELTSV
jgi:hypothetical protein